MAVDRSDADSMTTEFDVEDQLACSPSLHRYHSGDYMYIRELEVQSEDSGAICSQVSLEDSDEETSIEYKLYDRGFIRRMSPHSSLRKKQLLRKRLLGKNKTPVKEDKLHTAILRMFLRRNAKKIMDVELCRNGFTTREDMDEYEYRELIYPGKKKTIFKGKQFHDACPEECFKICSSISLSPIRIAYEEILQSYRYNALSKSQILSILERLSYIFMLSPLKADQRSKREITRIKELLPDQNSQPKERASYFRMIQEMDKKFDILPPRQRIRCCFDTMEYLDCANFSSCRVKKDFREKCCLIFPSVDDILVKSVVPSRHYIDWFIKHIEEVQNTQEKKRFHQCTYLLGRMQACLVSRALIRTGSLSMHYDLQQSILDHLLKVSNPVLLWNLLKCDVDLLNNIPTMKQHDIELLYMCVRKKLQTMSIVCSKFYLTRSSSRDSTSGRLISKKEAHFRSFSTNTPANFAFLIILDEVTRSQPTLSRIFNIPLSWIWENEINDENEKIFLYQVRSGQAVDMLRSDISSEMAGKLFKCHKNLNAISASHIVSTGYKSNRHRIIQKRCIVFYCDKKGAIPWKENLFPKMICGMQTDVREGFFKFASKVQTGEPISSIPSKRGTGGGFVDLGDTVGLLTCAHVLYDLRDLKSGHLQSGKKVMNANSNVNLGNVRKALFRSNVPGEVSVDAAVIALNPDVSVDCSFPSTDSLQIHEAGFRHTPSSFSSVILQEIPEVKRKNQIIKFGTESGLTSGSLRVHGIHARMRDISLGIEEGGSKNQMTWKEEFNMFGQYEVCSNTLLPFLKQGDSGSLVYMVNNPDGTDLRCIGMAIGISSYGTCIVTPIHKILDGLELPKELKVNAGSDSIGGSLEQNSSHSNKDPLSIILERLTSIDRAGKQTADVGLKTAEAVSNIEKDLKTLKSSFSSLDKRVQNVEFNLPSSAVSSDAQFSADRMDED